MATEHFCLRWNNHQSTLVSVFDNLLESGTLVDCTLAADGRYLKAHKVVLSACSPYLGMLLSQHYDKHPIIILKDVKFDELKAMLDYMYRGEVNISQDQLSTFLKAAETLQIKGLTDTGAEEGIQPNRPPSSNSTTSAPTEEPLSPSSAGPNSPNPKKRKRNKPSDDPPDEKQAGSDQNASVSSLSALKNVSFGSVKREPTEKDVDGDGVMSVDDSNDSAMMARPGPSNGSGNNNKGSPWVLSADSGGEEMQLTPGQDGGSKLNKENPDVIDLREETPEVKEDIDDVKEEITDVGEDIIEVSVKTEPHPVDPLCIESVELIPSFKIIKERMDEMIVPDIIDNSTIDCDENCHDYIRVIHPDQLKELTSNEISQTSEGDAQTDSSVVKDKGSPQREKFPENIFSRPKTADQPGSVKGDTNSEKSQSNSQAKQINTKSAAAQIKISQPSKLRKIMPKGGNSESNVQNKKEFTVSNQPTTSTTNVQITTTAQNITAGQFLPYTTTTVSSSCQQVHHSLALPMQISTAAVAHPATGVLQPQWIVQPHLASQPQPTFVAIPQQMLIAPTIISRSDATQQKDTCYISTSQSYIQPSEPPVQNKPAEVQNKLPIPKIPPSGTKNTSYINTPFGYVKTNERPNSQTKPTEVQKKKPVPILPSRSIIVSRCPVHPNKPGIPPHLRGRGIRVGPRASKSVRQHIVQRPANPDDVQRFRLNRENEEFSNLNKIMQMK